MKIAFYSHSIAPSIDGVCRRFTSILYELERIGHETIMFTMEDEPQELPKSTRTITLDHMIFPTYPSKKVARPTWQSFNAIYTVLRDEKPDVIHIVSDGFSEMFSCVALLLGIPIVGSFHTDIIDLLTQHDAYFVQKLLVYTKEAIDSIVLDSCATTSKSFQKKLSLQGCHCEHIIVTAVDVKKFSPSKSNSQVRKELMFGDEDGFLCVYVGRISNEKRIDIIIDAIRELTGEQNSYIAIIGDGPSAPYFSKVHGKENRIYCMPRFLGHEELAEIYASSDLHVSASEFETLGNTVLEAFASGIPVVVPRTQGFQDTVRHKVDGFLFNPGDRDDAKRFLQLLKDDSSLRSKMGEEGRIAVQTRTIEFVVKDLLHWYKECGIERRKLRSVLNNALCSLLLIIMVVVTVFLFFLYEKILVKRVLKSYLSNIQYATTAPQHVKLSREDADTVSSKLRNPNGVGKRANGEKRD